ncbi:MAG: hypothetical protein DRQ63_09355 [Gammaproteobacteria bacterium]|nr:MAG: hypothetical protein DRQ63_09355 [Gammaproteobacteria bacterium]
MTAATGKTVNYTDAMTTELVAGYSDCDSDETRKETVSNFAVKFGKNEKSIRAKLVREGVYQKPAYVSKAGAKVERKSDIVQGIAAALGVTEAQLGGLEKATKPALELSRAAFQIARENETS